MFYLHNFNGQRALVDLSQTVMVETFICYLLYNITNIISDFSYSFLFLVKRKVSKNSEKLKFD